MFELKNYKKIKSNAVGIFLTCVLLVYSTVTKAHEMWLEPVRFTVTVDEGLLIHEVVGQKFNGNKYAYLDKTFESLNITVGDKTEEITSRLGDLPAIQEKSKEEGLHIVTGITTPSFLTYDKAEIFSNFLNEDGLQWVFAEHKKRGLPEVGFSEIYRRNAKTLIKVGHGKGQDRAIGLPFEWVVQNNLYTSHGDITMQLLWQGKPATNMHVNIFNKPTHQSLSSDVKKFSLTTDAKGMITVPRAAGGLFLINAVKMIEPDEKTQQKTNAVWESIWASLTFKI